MNNWMEEARQYAAQCWCDKETENIVMNPILAEAVAKRIATWMKTAVQNQRNVDYYRGLLEQCGNIIGDRAFIADDGSRSENVLCAKIPEIIKADYKPTKLLRLIDENDELIAEMEVKNPEQCRGISQHRIKEIQVIATTS